MEGSLLGSLSLSVRGTAAKTPANTRPGDSSGIEMVLEGVRFGCSLGAFWISFGSSSGIEMCLGSGRGRRWGWITDSALGAARV